MDPAACRVIYIDDRFNTERWISREGTSPQAPQRVGSQSGFSDLPQDLQANVNAFLSVFNQVYVCRSGRAFSTKLSELNDQVKSDCTPIIACFDVGSEAKHAHFARVKSRFAPGTESPLPSPSLFRREITFSSESDESYGLQLLSRIASDLQVEEGVQLIIPVAIVQPNRRDSYDRALLLQTETPFVKRAPYGPEIEPTQLDTDQSDTIDPQMMLQCLDAGALDVVRSPLDKAGIMGLTVHAYRVYKKAMNEQKGFMASTRRRRKQSWVGVEEEKPYAYLREAMVKKLLKGICDPQNLIEDYQHRDLIVTEDRKPIIAYEIGKWSFCGHDFSEDELVYAGYLMLNHALSMPQLEEWRITREELLRFMQGCQVAYNSFVLYHNFRHAVDVLQSLFYFLIQIGTLPSYPPDSEAPPFANDKSPVAKLLGPFEALTLLISAIGHDVGHPGVNNMFLVKLNAPLAQLYNDQSVLEAFHCAAYSQILRRHWPMAFNHKALRKLMISSILATDMGVHSDYMQQLGNLQEKISESKVTDGWSPKDIDQYRQLTCGLLIKCADISNVSRPWIVAEKWTHLLQEEFANQGEMEAAVGMETTLFGGPPEIGNMLKLANGQIGFMTIFAHPLFANVTDVIPAMGFAANEILTNKGVWFTRAEKEKMRQQLKEPGFREAGAVSPRSRSPTGQKRREMGESSAQSPLRGRQDASPPPDNSQGANLISEASHRNGSITPTNRSPKSSLSEVAAIATPPINSAKQPPVGPTAALEGPAARNDKDSIDRVVDGSQRQFDTAHPDTKRPLESTSMPNTLDEREEAVNEGDGGLDERRDTGISMRAGSSSLPILNGNEISTVAEEKSKAQQTLTEFTFATSHEDEPVRRFVPDQDYHPDHPENRASEPLTSPEHQQASKEVAPAMRCTSLTTSDVSTRGTNSRGDSEGGRITPIQRNTSTSHTTAQSVQSSPNPQDVYESSPSRNRAISAPLGSPLLNQAYSLSSDQSSNREEDPTDRNRKPSSRTIGRRRSRMKLKDLAFWKKNKSDRNADESTEAATG